VTFPLCRCRRLCALSSPTLNLLQTTCMLSQHQSFGERHFRELDPCHLCLVPEATLKRIADGAYAQHWKLAYDAAFVRLSNSWPRHPMQSGADHRGKRSQCLFATGAALRLRLSNCRSEAVGSTSIKHEATTKCLGSFMPSYALKLTCSRVTSRYVCKVEATQRTLPSKSSKMLLENNETTT